MDGVGNVFGRWEAGEGPAVLAGSHLDTVPEGGPLDGTLGVCAALEAVRAMKEAGIRPARPVEVVCTADEEGRFGGMLGSQAICGEVGADFIAAAADETGRPLSEALAEAGLDASGPLARDMGSVAAFLELHVEQGPVDETRLTVGKVALSPNFSHSVAGEAAFSVVGRDADDGVLTSLRAATRAALERAAEAHGLDLAVREASFLPPTPLDGALVGELHALARSCGLSTRLMTSGAGHDAQTFARHCPAGLLFVPSVGGVSHAPHEWTAWPDALKGATLLARAVARLATR